MPDPTPARPVALVTGAFRGIGRACALALARSGFRVALNDRPGGDSDRAAADLGAEIADCGSDATPALGDIGDLDAHEAIVAAALNLGGRIDCLINNAGIAAQRRGDLLAVQAASFDECFRINTRGLFFLTQRIARHMLDHPDATAGHRSIVNITSSNAVGSLHLAG